MNCWFWNIDSDVQPFFAEELVAGRLRQGWGYEDDLDLIKLKAKVDSHTELSEKEQEAYNRCADMLVRISVGDLIVVKNIPNREGFTIVKVAEGGYQFQRDPSLGDYGHILPVAGHKRFSKYSSVVPAPFRSALNKARSPIIVTYKHKEAVEHLYATTASEDELSTPENREQKLLGVRQALIQALKTSLAKELDAALAEYLVLNLMRQRGLESTWTAGPSECGADVLSTLYSGFGIESRMAVQVKFHPGEDNDLSGLDQLERASVAHGADALLLVSFADTLGERVKARLAKLKQTHNIGVIYGVDLYEALLSLIADPDHELGD